MSNGYEHWRGELAKLRYNAEQTVKAAALALEIECRGIQIRLPEGGPNTITFYFESVDASGNVVEQRPLTRPIPAGIQAQVDALVNNALGRVSDAGYPAGGTIRQ